MKSECAKFFEITKEGTEITKVILIVKNKLYKRVEVFKLEKKWETEAIECKVEIKIWSSEYRFMVDA